MGVGREHFLGQKRHEEIVKCTLHQALIHGRKDLMGVEEMYYCPGEGTYTPQDIQSEALGPIGVTPLSTSTAITVVIAAAAAATDGARASRRG